jgi:segregation and condensation protein A
MDDLDNQNPPLPVAGESEPEGEGYRVQVGQFEGPLDLLLHLVRVNEIDIADIPIVEVTAQYNEHLELMRDLNLEIAGEYIVMAATLMQIKSRMLLPPNPTLGDEEEAEDPRAALAQQLLEYQRFKQAAETLQAMDRGRSLIWSRDSVPEEYEGEELLAADLFDLLKSFRELLGRLGEDARLEIMRDTVSIAEKITWLTDLLECRSSIELLTLLEDLPSRLERIATFLAVLEMIRLQLAVAFQRKSFGEIRLTACEEDGEDDRPGREEG